MCLIKLTMNINKPNEIEPEIKAQYLGVRPLRNEFTSVMRFR